MGVELGRSNVRVHAPDAGAVVGGSGEIKTKPTQHSVKELRGIGIQPDMLLCRCQRSAARGAAPQDRAVHQCRGARGHLRGRRRRHLQDSVLLHEQGLDEIVVDKLRLEVPPTDLAEWRQVVSAQGQPRRPGRHRHGRQVRADPRLLHVAARGADARRPEDPHARQHPLHRVHRHRAARHRTRSRAWTRSWCRAASASAASRARSRRCATRASTASRTSASASACRWRSSSSAATCSGWRDANSTEFDRATPHPVIALITEWQDQAHGAQQRDEDSAKGGTMRLGAQEVLLAAGTRGARALRTRRDPRAPPPPLRVQQQLPGALPQRRACASRASRATAWWRSSSCRSTRGSSRPSSTRSSPPRRATAIRCSPASSAPRARSAPRSCRSRGAEAHGTPSAARMKLPGYEVGIDRPLFLIAGPCVIESRGAHRRRSPGG